MSFRAIERQANHLPREVVGFGVLRGTSHGRRTWSCHFRLGPRLAAALGWRQDDFVRLLWGGFWLGIALFWVSQGSVSPNLFKAFVIVLLLLSGAVMAKRIAEHHRKRAAG